MDRPSGGYIQMDTGFHIPVVRLTGSPYERGFQRGQQIPDVIRRRVSRVVQTYDKAALREAALRVADSEEVLLGTRAPSILEELQGIAKATSINWDDLRLSALVITVHHYPPAFAARGFYDGECLCFVASGPATVDGRPFLGKNGDFVRAVTLPEDNFVMEVLPDHGNAYVAVGPYPERVTQPEGMNEKGLTVVGAGQYPKDGYDAYERGLPTGISVFQLLSLIYTECSTLEEALAYLRESPRGYTGRVMMLADANGAWVKVEVTYNNLRVQYPEPDSTYPANHVAAGVSGTYGSPEMQALITSRVERPAAYDRYDRIMNLLIRNAGMIDLNFVQNLLRDHNDQPGVASICKHVDGPDLHALPWPSLEALPTLESFIFEPTEKRGWVVNGPPCRGEFKQFGLPMRAALSPS